MEISEEEVNEIKANYDRCRNDPDFIAYWTMMADTKPPTFLDQYVGRWDPMFNAVFSRERIMTWLSRGEISEHEARILFDLEYDQKGRARDSRR